MATPTQLDRTHHFILAPGDDAALRAFLDGAGLPSDDVAAERQEFIVAIEDGRIVGSALELAEPDALIRSLAVALESRGLELGAALTDRAGKCCAREAACRTRSASCFRACAIHSSRGCSS